MKNDNKMKVTLESQYGYELFKFEHKSSEIIEYIYRNKTISIVKVVPISGEAFYIPVLNLRQAQVVKEALEQNDTKVISGRLYAYTKDFLDYSNIGLHYYYNSCHLAFSFSSSFYDGQCQDRKDILEGATDSFTVNATSKVENCNNYATIELKNGIETREFEGRDIDGTSMCDDLIHKFSGRSRSFETSVTDIVPVSDNKAESQYCCKLYCIKTGFCSNKRILFIEFDDTTWVIDCKGLLVTNINEFSANSVYSWVSREHEASRKLEAQIEERRNARKATAF